MKDFILYLFTQIVSQPEKIEITESEEGGLVLYNVKVALEDMGPVIGKEGKTINSIRSLVRAKAIKDGVRVRVNLVEDVVENEN